MKKKKIVNIFAGIVLGAAFIAAAVFAVRQSHLEEETETEKKSLKVNPPEALTPYQIGDEVQVGDFLWQVLEAELIEDYDSLDDYYKQRGYLKAPQPGIQNPFAEEQRFLRVTFSVKNVNEESDREFSFLKLEYANYRGDGIFDKWELYHTPWYNKGSYSENGSYTGSSYPEKYRYFDGKCTVRNSAASANYFDDFSNITLAPGEILDVESVIQFYEYGNIYEFGVENEYVNLNTKMYLYDLCLKAFGTGVSRAQYISLNIAPKHQNITQTEIDNTYEEQRDIAAMKAGQMTNLDIRQYQESGHPTNYLGYYNEEEGEKPPEEQIVEQNTVLDYNLCTQIRKSEIVEWKDMPEIFKSQGYLQKMAERYQKDYGYSEDQLKILLLDITYSGNDRIDAKYFPIYEYTWLYTRDSDKKRWLFGTADDWTVVSNTAHTERTGHINTEWIRKDQIVTVSAAYLLPPDIYQQEDALYFCAGMEWENYCEKIAEIKLK